MDCRLLRSILERGDAAVPEILAYAKNAPQKPRLDLSTLLVDLFRHYKTPEALEYYLAVLRENPDDVGDELIQALLGFGPAVLDPLLKLYEELGEEQGSDLGFVLAGLRIHDPRVLEVLLDRLEYDAADGAFCLGLYGDPAARPALEQMLAEIPAEEVELRREISHALEALDAPVPKYEAEPFDLLADYPEIEAPEFEVLTDEERFDLLKSSDPLARAGAARSFFNTELDPKVRDRLCEIAKTDAEAQVRGRAWETLADATETAAIRDAMIAVVNDKARPVEERGGAAVGLYAVADQKDARAAIEALYEEGVPKARAKALEAMWRSLFKPYAKYFAPHIEDSDVAVRRQALRGAGYFRLTTEVDRIEKQFEADDQDVREDALFAYALAMPGKTSRGRVQGMLRKIDSITPLDHEEAELVMFALDERLRLEGLEPVFENGAETEELLEEETPPEKSAAVEKVGRNDPCPCGSGKKYKKCHGA